MYSEVFKLLSMHASPMAHQQDGLMNAGGCAGQCTAYAQPGLLAAAYTLPARTRQPAALGSVALLQLLLVLEGGKAEDVVHDATLGHLVHEWASQLTLAAKAAGLDCQRLLGLLGTGRE